MSWGDGGSEAFAGGRGGDCRYWLAMVRTPCLSLALRSSSLAHALGFPLRVQLENRMRVLDSVGPPRISHTKGTPAKAKPYASVGSRSPTAGKWAVTGG